MAAFVEQVSDSADWSAETAQSALGERGGLAARLAAARSQQVVETAARHDRLGLLTRVVEAEVLPRLALARGAALAAGGAVREAGTPALTLCTTSTEEDSAELVRLLLTREPDDALAYVDLLRERGATVEVLFLGVISRAARVLGELWEDDRCDFTQVTIGTGRLQQIVRALSPGFQIAAVRRPQPESVLLLPAPGEQHTFGLVLLGEFFSRAGWHVGGGPRSAGRGAAELAHEVWFDIVGFSVGSDQRLDLLAKTIHAVRRASRNRDIGVMVGGPLYLAKPELVGRVGADTGAIDAASAVQQASGLVSLRAVAH